MFDVAIPLVVELVLSASYILPPSSSPASFVLVFLLIFFLAFSLRLPFLTVILLFMHHKIHVLDAHAHEISSSSGLMLSCLISSYLNFADLMLSNRTSSDLILCCAILI